MRFPLLAVAERDDDVVDLDRRMLDDEHDRTPLALVAEAADRFADLAAVALDPAVTEERVAISHRVLLGGTRRGTTGEQQDDQDDERDAHGAMTPQRPRHVQSVRTKPIPAITTTASSAARGTIRSAGWSGRTRLTQLPSTANQAADPKPTPAAS